MEKDNRAIRYWVYPTEKQRNILQQTFGCARLVFNETLLMHRGLYEAGMKPFSQMDMNNYCNRYPRSALPWSSESCLIVQEVPAAMRNKKLKSTDFRGR